MPGPAVARRRRQPEGAPPYFASFPSTSPKAQVSTVMLTAIEASAGTRTAAGPKPSPQQPVKMAWAISLLVPASRTVNTGDLPKGFQPTYSSPARPK